MRSSFHLHFHGDHIFVSIISLDIQTHTYNLNVLLSLINYTIPLTLCTNLISVLKLVTGRYCRVNDRILELEKQHEEVSEVEG